MDSYRCDNIRIGLRDRQCILKDPNIRAAAYCDNEIDARLAETLQDVRKTFAEEMPVDVSV